MQFPEVRIKSIEVESPTRKELAKTLRELHAALPAYQAALADLEMAIQLGRDPRFYK